MESLIDQLETEKRKLRQETERADAALASLESSGAESQALQASSLQEISKLEKQVEALTREIDQVKQQSEADEARMKEGLSSDVGDMAKKLDASLLARESLMKDLNAVKDKLKASQEDLKVTRECQQSLQKNIDKLNSDLSTRDKKIQSLEDKQKQLEKQVESTRSERDKFKKEADSKSKEISRLKEKLSSTEKSTDDKAKSAKEAVRKEMAKRLDSAHEEYRKKLADKERDFKQQLDQARKEAAAKLAKSEDSLRAQMAQMKKKLDQDLAAAKKNFEIEGSQLAESRQKIENELKQQISDLMQRLGEEEKLKEEELRTSTQVQKSLQQELSESKQKNSQLLEKVKVVQEEKSRLKQKVGDAEASEKEARTLCAKAQKAQKELQKSLEDLEKEKKAASERAKQRLANELANLDKEWSKKAETKCKEAMEETIVLHKKEMKDVEAKLEAEKEEEKRLLQEAADKKLANLRVDLSTEIGNLENDLLDEKALHKKNVQEEKTAGENLRRDLTLKQEEEVRTLNEKFDNEKENMATDFAAKLESSLDQAMKERLSAEIDLTNKHMDQVDKLNAAAAEAAESHRLKLEETVAHWNQRLDDQALSLNDKHTAEMNALQKTLSDDFFSQIQDSDKKHQQEVKKLQAEARERSAELSNQGKEIQDLKTSFSDLRDECEKMKNANSDLQQRMLEESQNAAMAMSDLRHAHADAITDLEKKNENAMNYVEMNHKEEKDVIISGYDKRILEHEAIFADLTNKYEDLDGRFQARESREEDLQMIADLRAEMVRKDEVLEDTMQKMKELKIELLNREESYNKNFANGGSAPTKATARQDAILSWMLKSKKEARIDSARRKMGQAMASRRASMF